MTPSVDAGARQVRPNTAVSSAPKAPATASTSSAAPQAKPAADSFQPAQPKKAAPVALNAPQAPAAPQGNPPIKVDGYKDTPYGKLEGTPFIQGQGDAAPASWNDIDQGQLGDCYFMSSMGAVAQANPELIQNAIKDNGDGTYTVRFYEKKGDGLFGLFGHHYEAKEITVTPDVPMQNGVPVFAGTGDTDGAKKELWPALMEKAFAQWKGSYQEIGGGGWPYDAMSMLTGKDSTHTSASNVTIDQLDQALSSGQAVCANTMANGKGKEPYANGTLVANHSYMVTGVDKAKGEVTLHNPWDSNLPAVTMSIADFNKYISTVDVNPTR